MVRDGLHHDLEEQACNHEYVIFGDTNHFDPAIMKFVGERHTVAAMRECGINKIFLELKPEHQTVIDALITGQITRNDFVANNLVPIRGDSEALADMILALGAAGMDVYAADRSAQELDTMAHIPSIMQGFFAFGEVVMAAGEEDLAADIISHALGVQTLSAESMQRMAEIVHANQDHPSFQKAQDFFAQADRIKAEGPKRTDDSMLADFIQTHKAQGERVAIMIGNAHPADREKGIDVLLGPDKTAWLALHGENGSKNTVPADRIYDLTAREVIIPAPIP